MPGRIGEAEYHRRVEPVWAETERLIALRDGRGEQREEAKAA